MMAVRQKGRPRMATEKLQITEISGLNVYFVVVRLSDAYVLDFSDNTFKALGSATTPYVSASASTVAAGYGNSRYSATIDLAYLSNALAPVDCVAVAYLRAGGSPNLTTDAALGEIPLEQIRFALKNPDIDWKFTPVFKRELDTVDFDCIVLANGTPISFNGTGVLTVRDAAGSLLFAALSSSTITDSGDSLKHLKFTKTTPGFTGDRYYSARLVLTEGSATFTIQDTFRMLA